MHVISHTALPRESLAGDRRLCAVDRSCGITQFETWIHELDAGAASAALSYPAEQAVLVLAGCGKLLLAGAPQRFQAPCTLIVPPGVECQIVNHGAQALQYVAVLATLNEPPVAPSELPISGGEARHPTKKGWPVDGPSDGSCGRCGSDPD